MSNVANSVSYVTNSYPASLAACASISNRDVPRVIRRLHCEGDSLHGTSLILLAPEF